MMVLTVLICPLPSVWNYMIKIKPLAHKQMVQWPGIHPHKETGRFVLGGLLLNLKLTNSIPVFHYQQPNSNQGQWTEWSCPLSATRTLMATTLENELTLELGPSPLFQKRESMHKTHTTESGICVITISDLPQVRAWYQAIQDRQDKSNALWAYVTTGKKMVTLNCLAYAWRTFTLEHEHLLRARHFVRPQDTD